MFELTQTADLCHWKGDASDRAWLAFSNDIRRFTHKGEHTASGFNSTTGQTQRRKPGVVTALGMAIVVVAGTAAWALLREGGSAATASADSTASTPAPATIITNKSIAVLPLDDFSASGDEAYFADGLTEEILTALSRTPDLLVASRTSSFQYKDKTVDIKRVASELNVAHVLEGSVRRSADRLRVTVQLIRASDGFHLWSENYDRTPDDLIAVQEDIAFQIATALQTAMDPAALKQMVEAGTHSVAAYNAYLQGIGLAQPLGGYLSRQTYEKFEQARAIDPAFANAHERAARYWEAQLQPNLVRGETSTQELLSPAAMLALSEERIQLAVSTAKPPDQQLYRMRLALLNLQLTAARGFAEQYLDANPSLSNLGTGYRGYAMIIVQLMYQFGETEKALALIGALAASSVNNASDADGLVNNFYYLDALATGRDYALAMVERFPAAELLLYQTHRLLLSGGWVDEAREIMQKVRGTDLEATNINLMRLRQACAEGDLATANKLFGESISTADAQSAWQLLHVMGRPQQAAAQLLPMDQPDTLYSLSSLLSYPFFDINHYPNLKATLERDGVPLPVYRPIPYACAAPQP